MPHPGIDIVPNDDFLGIPLDHQESQHRFPDHNQQTPSQRRTRTKHVQELSTKWHSVRKLISRLPTPCGDHRENEVPTAAEQRLIDAGVVLADRLGDMGEIELDGSAAARLEVNEQRSAASVEHVAWVRLAVKQLLGSSAVANHSSQPSQCAGEHQPRVPSHRRSGNGSRPACRSRAGTASG